MHAFFDVLRFELRLHLASHLFWGVALLFFALHFLTLTRTGINLGDYDNLDINSPWMIFQTELVLGVFGMVPAIMFAVTAITRDHDRNTLELFYSTPVSRNAFVLGRFSAGTLAAVLVAFAGLLGAFTGSLMPWLDPDRIAPLEWSPWFLSFTTLALPNVLVFCSLFFAVAALTRSAAMTFGAAMLTIALDVFLNTQAKASVAPWLMLADPFAAIPISQASRFWSIKEFNTLLPTTFLLPNRLLWLAIAAGVVTITCRRYRMELVPGGWRRFLRARAPRAAPQPQLQPVIEVHQPRFDSGATLLQFVSQLRMDWRGVLLSPLFWIVIALAMANAYSEASQLKSFTFDLPLYPSTTLMLGFFGGGISQYVLILVIWYSAFLVHRERDCRVDGMSGAAPCADWIPVTSKSLVLFGIIALVLFASMAASIAVQVLADYPRYEIGLYLQGLFIYNGVHFFMLCVLAVIIQVASPGKWSGMLLTVIAYVILLSLFLFGFEHLLYGFRIPSVVHSDMNGFGHFRLPTYTLIAYWSAFCVLLLVAGHLLFPRGHYASVRERLHDARTRITLPVIRVAAVATAAFLAAGSFIFYNTNILNQYTTNYETEAQKARYELDYGQYRYAPAPSIAWPDVHLELYAAKRRLESRGTAKLLNTTSRAIGDFVLNVDPRDRIQELVVEGATLVKSDPARGFHLFRPEASFDPGAALTMRWALVRENRGFPNANPDNEIVQNGTYLRRAPLPGPGYCLDCELEVGRKRFGLPPPRGLPALGDPAHLDDLWPGLNVRSGFHIVIGTDADQTAVAPGELKRSWEQEGRRYFEYGLDGPVWPGVTILSARYAVTRDEWNGVKLEIFNDPRHAWNVPTMLETMKKAMSYYSREFGAYPLPYFRMAAYPRYKTNVQAGVGLIAYSEISGFMTDLRNGPGLDYGVLHELAHMWWGNVYGARMQGRQVLNEGLAQYSTFMMLKEHADPKWVRKELVKTHDGYLNGRKAGGSSENPVIRTDVNQEHLGYGKSALAMFALQELIGADKVNGALRAYYERFVDMKPPFPTTLDLVRELRAVAGREYQRFITDYFEKIVLFDVGISSASVKRVVAGYEITMDIDARQFEADGVGNETEVPLDTWFQIAVFPHSDKPQLEQHPLYQHQHRLHSGSQRVTVVVAESPAAVVVDPFRLMIDRVRENNQQEL